MFWTRKSRRPHAQAALALAAAAATAALAGCTTSPKPQVEEASTAPVAIDEAMQRRGDWPRVAAEFKAGGVEAGVTRFPYQPQTEGPDAGRAIFGNERSNALLDPIFFVAQTIALPFTYIIDPPFTEKTHRGVVYDATYTAMPLLPPDEDPGEGEHAMPVQPAPEETAPVTPDAAEASEMPEAPEEAPLEIRPEQMPGEEADPDVPADMAPEPGEILGPESLEPIPEDRDLTPDEPEVMPEDSAEPIPDPEPVPESFDPAPEESEPAPLEPEMEIETTEPLPEPAESELEPGEPEREPAESELEPAESELEPGEPELEPAESELEPAESEATKPETESVEDPVEEPIEESAPAPDEDENK